MRAEADVMRWIEMRWTIRIGCIAVALTMIGPVSAQGPAPSPSVGPTRPELPSADDLPDPPPAPRVASTPAEPSVQSGAGLAACLAWTDGCVACERADGK